MSKRRHPKPVLHLFFEHLSSAPEQGNDGFLAYCGRALELDKELRLQDKDRRYLCKGCLSAWRKEHKR